jgi:hypothetical protein
MLGRQAHTIPHRKARFPLGPLNDNSIISSESAPSKLMYQIHQQRAKPARCLPTSTGLWCRTHKLDSSPPTPHVPRCRCRRRRTISCAKVRTQRLPSPSDPARYAMYPHTARGVLGSLSPFGRGALPRALLCTERPLGGLSGQSECFLRLLFGLGSRLNINDSRSCLEMVCVVRLKIYKSAPSR